MTGKPVSETEGIIGYSFSNRDLLEKALTHSSSINENSIGRDYERLEFLGDAVLELITREYLLSEYPDESEGDLTRRKIRIVQKGNLSKHGRRLGLNRFAKVGHGFVSSESAVESVAADIVESLIGAIYIDSGLQSAREFVTREILRQSDESGPLPDARSRLQEHCQSEGWKLPEYRVIRKNGPDHKPVFTVSVSIGGKETGIGTGLNRKTACAQAAENALETLERKV